MFFYRRVDEDLLRKLSPKLGDPSVFYRLRGRMCPLSFNPREKRENVKDINETWKIEEDGFGFALTLSLDNLDALYGPEGLAPKGSSVSVCLLWTCLALNQKGVLLPSNESVSSDGANYVFRHYFEAGTIDGDLLLEPILYLKESSICSSEAESCLANTVGIKLGEVAKPIAFDFRGSSMEFPIVEVDIPGEPLWWVDFSDWDEGPQVEPFTEDSVSLYLNKAHKECPTLADGQFKGQDVLAEIMASAYFVIIEKIREYGDEAWAAVQYGENFEAGSICSVIYEFSQKSGEKPFRWGTVEQRMKSSRAVVESVMRLAGGADE